MKHKLVGVHKNMATHGNIDFWVTMFICDCGFLSYAEEGLDKHILEMNVSDLTDRFIKTVSESFSKDDS